MTDWQEFCHQVLTMLLRKIGILFNILWIYSKIFYAVKSKDNS